MNPDDVPELARSVPGGDDRRPRPGGLPDGVDLALDLALDLEAGIVASSRQRGGRLPSGFTNEILHPT